MSEKQIIEFDKSNFEKLKKEYQNAINKKQDQFEFEGKILLTSYAKYLIEYLSGKL